MRRALPGLALLWLAGFCLTTWLEPWWRNRARSVGAEADVLAVVLGDSGELLARHLYAKADAYFHSGYYPSVFERQTGERESHLSEHSTRAHAQGLGQEDAVFGPPKDWLDRFSRHFHPKEHRHLGQAAHGAGRGTERELLPWLYLAARLDPGQPETFLVTAYWLRSYLNRVDEAEQFIRQGLRSNPGHPELLFELGRIFLEQRRDSGRARNVWELAWAQWQRRGLQERESNRLFNVQLLANLAKLEEDEGRPGQALVYLRALLEVTPNRPQVQEWIERVGAVQPEDSQAR